MYLTIVNIGKSYRPPFYQYSSKNRINCCLFRHVQPLLPIPLDEKVRGIYNEAEEWQYGRVKEFSPKIPLHGIRQIYDFSVIGGLLVLSFYDIEFALSQKV